MNQVKINFDAIQQEAAKIAESNDAALVIVDALKGNRADQTHLWTNDVNEKADIVTAINLYLIASRRFEESDKSGIDSQIYSLAAQKANENFKYEIQCGLNAALRRTSFTLSENMVICQLFNNLIRNAN